jgi:hypothetical protein
LAPASSAGIYSAQAANLSVDGTWNVTVLVQRPAGSVEIPVTLTTRRQPVKIDVSRSPGLPAVYTIHATSTDNVQVYLERVRPGLTEFHVTFIGSDGTEAAANKLTVSASRAGTASSPTALTVRKLDNVGHFVADLEGAAAGRYQFTMDATLANGQPIHADIALPIS